MSVAIVLLPCWKYGCPGDQQYVKTVVSPSGCDRWVYNCTDCSHTVEIAPEDVAEYMEDFSEIESGVRLTLHNALARVTFDEDGVHIS